MATVTQRDSVIVAPIEKKNLYQLGDPTLR